jgi:hypothetical protein
VVATGYSYQTWNSASGAAPRNAYSGMRDIFVLQLTNTGNYRWHTFMGGSDEEFAYALAVGMDGMIYIGGYSYAWNGPAGQLAQHAHAGGLDAFVVALLPNGDYLWHTFYGTSSTDKAEALALNSQNRLYVGGESALSWQGDASANPLHAHSTSGDVFVLRMEVPVYRLYAPVLRR